MQGSRVRSDTHFFGRISRRATPHLFFLAVVVSLFVSAITLAVSPSGENAARAQDKSNASSIDSSGGGQLKLPSQLQIPGLSGGFPGGGELELFASFTVAERGRDGELSVTARMLPDWHIYSLTQARGGPMRSELSVAPSSEFELTGKFRPDREPHARRVQEFRVPVEEHEDQVIWSAPIRLAEGVDPQSLNIHVRYDGQVCSDVGGCIPQENVQLVAEFAGYTSTGGEYRADKSHVTILGHVVPAVAAPGSRVKLVLAAAPDDKWHVYARQEKPKAADAIGSRPTLITLTSTGNLKAGPIVVSADPVEEETGLSFEPLLYYYDKPVSWTIEFEVPEDAKPGEQTIAGIIGYQTCQQSCDAPTAARFKVTVEVGSARGAAEQPMSFTPATYEEAEEEVVRAARTSALDAQPGDFYARLFSQLGFIQADELWHHQHVPGLTLSGGSLAVVAIALAIVVSFLGGMILNVMPCVLPVIGLKVMSFVQQAGESRWRILSLNLWYSLGMLLVFWTIATVAAALHLAGETFAWGQHLGDVRFAIPLVGVVFVLGLWLLGVWEIPIPGFVGGTTASQLAQTEGPVGAVFKGAIATVLATPCSGPFIGLAVGIAVIAPIWLNYLLFTFMGLGMAAPYLLIGAIPGLIRVLPKPGQWMDTFKQVMGFVLLATVVWIFSFLESSYLVPTLVLLMALGFGCWLVGRVPAGAELFERLKAWAAALLLIAAVSLVLFARGKYVVPAVSLIAGIGVGGWLVLKTRKLAARGRTFGWITGVLMIGVAAVVAYVAIMSASLPWQPFSRAALEEHRREGSVVLVDFTADWCLTCKTNETVALNTRKTKRVVDALGVVTLKADKTQRTGPAVEEVDRLLVELGNDAKAIPYYAVYPIDGGEPIVFGGRLITEAEVIEALERAAQTAPSSGQTAMTP